MNLNTLFTKNNFILDLDNEIKRKEVTYIFKKVVYDVDNKPNINFILRKEKNKTRVLYVKNNVRVRFTDNDILEMILEINDKDVVSRLLDILKLIYNSKEYDTTSMKVGNKKYIIPLLPEINCCQMLKNRKDVDISFEDIYVLINLIIAKDIASTNVINKMDYLKRTLAKYILVIGRYYFNGEKEQKFFRHSSIDYTGDFYFDFEACDAAKENVRKVMDYELFENLHIIC